MQSAALGEGRVSLPRVDTSRLTSSLVLLCARGSHVEWDAFLFLSCIDTCRSRVRSLFRPPIESFALRSQTSERWSVPGHRRTNAFVFNGKANELVTWVVNPRIARPCTSPIRFESLTQRYRARVITLPNRGADAEASTCPFRDSDSNDASIHVDLKKLAPEAHKHLRLVLAFQLLHDIANFLSA